MKLLVIFDPTAEGERPHIERTQEAAVAWLQNQDEPAAFTVHEHRVSDDADTIVCLLNGDYCWPDPMRAWRVTNTGTLKPIPAPPSTPF